MWLQDYLVRIQRDVAERGRQRRVEEIPELLRVLAGRQTQELNASSVARDLDLKVDSVRNYVRLLEGHYLVHLIPAFAAAPLKHGVKRPKVLLSSPRLPLVARCGRRPFHCRTGPLRGGGDRPPG